MFITVIKFIELRYFAFIKKTWKRSQDSIFSAFIAFNFFWVTKPIYVFFFREGKDKKKYMIGYYTIVFFLFRPFDFYFLVLWNYKLYKNEDYFLCNGIRAAISKGFIGG
jgi:hypothetical protein